MTAATRRGGWRAMLAAGGKEPLGARDDGEILFGHAGAVPAFTRRCAAGVHNLAIVALVGAEPRPLWR